MSSIPEKARPALKLSPENYVKYRIQQQEVSSLPLSLTQTFEFDKDSFKTIPFSHDWDLLALLRSARLHKFEFSESHDPKARYVPCFSILI